MSPPLLPLIGAAVSIGCLHTLLGPDHYLPFVAMSRAGGWSRGKTMLVTLLCGIGHVASSVLIGSLGIAFGIGLNRLEGVEEARSGTAAWLLIAFGLAYVTWGIVHAFRGKSHSHVHVHPDGTVHTHPHAHQADHLHAHVADGAPRRMTPWILFTIFLFGPCEPLIPLLMYPASEASLWGVLLVTGLFTAATLLTMSAMVYVLLGGFALVRIPAWERLSHAVAGGVVLACGLAVKFGF